MLVPGQHCGVGVLVAKLSPVLPELCQICAGGH